MADPKPATPFQIGAIDHVVIMARDMAKAVAFWRDVMGVREERRIDEIGLIQMRAGASLIDLVPRKDDDRGGRNMEHICLTITPWDEADIRAHLARYGIEPDDTAERYGAGGYGPSIYLQDPDGNTIEIKGPSQRAR